jgi:hypothetical protein
VLIALLIVGACVVVSGTIACLCLIARMLDHRRARRTELQERRAEVLALRVARETRR